MYVEEKVILFNLGFSAETGQPLLWALGESSETSPENIWKGGANKQVQGR